MIYFLTSYETTLKIVYIRRPPAGVLGVFKTFSAWLCLGYVKSPQPFLASARWGHKLGVPLKTHQQKGSCQKTILTIIIDLKPFSLLS